MRARGPLTLPLVALVLVMGLAACTAPVIERVVPTEVLPASTPVSVAPVATEPPPPGAAVSPTSTAAPTATPAPTATQLPSPAPCTAPGEVVAGSFPSATAGGEHRYRLYYPPCYGSDGRTYPTLYLFAGNIHQESKWDELGIDEAANEAIAAGEMAPLLIVMPAGGWLADGTSGGPGSYESLVLDELIPHIEETTCAWPAPAGRAIGGISRGGYWALEIAFRHPGQFLSAGGHSAALLDAFADPDVNPQQTALTNDLGDLRIYLDIGDNDYLRTNTIRLHEDMAVHGVAHEWRLNEGEHNDAYWSAHTAEYLRWYTAPWPAERAAYPPCPGG